MTDRPTIRQLFIELGYDVSPNDFDEAVVWLMAEVSSLRVENAELRANEESLLEAGKLAWQDGHRSGADQVKSHIYDLSYHLQGYRQRCACWSQMQKCPRCIKTLMLETAAYEAVGCSDKIE